ncbi:MAG: thioredoxin domain-containing protein [Myxococcota bacterium]
MTKYNDALQNRNKTLRVFSRSIALIAIVGISLTSLVGCGPLGLERDSGNAAAPISTPGGDAVALVIEGDTITVDELHTHMQSQFMEEFLRQPEANRFEMQETAIRDMVQRRVVEAAAAERGLTKDELFEEISNSAPEPSVQDVASWYSENQSRLRGARLEDVAGQIKELLTNEARGNAWNEFIGPKLEALDWEMVLAPPRQDLEATRLIRGDPAAEVTIMAFSDYQCPYCIRSEPVLAEVLERYPEDVRVVYRHFPLDSIHPFARPAAEASMCAEEQGKFWEFHDQVFALKGKIAEGSLAKIGADIGLDTGALDACMSERRYQEFVQNDFLAGQAAGVTGTPAFFVNGIALKGARDADELSRIVESELARN